MRCCPDHNVVVRRYGHCWCSCHMPQIVHPAQNSPECPVCTWSHTDAEGICQNCGSDVLGLLAELKQQG